MNGFKEITTDWVSLNGLEIKDINGNVASITMLSGDEFYIQISGNALYGNVALYVWHGTKPMTDNVAGAEVLFPRQQAKLVKGIDEIWVRAASAPIILTIRKVQ